jgi:gluconate 2-dehydrogenase gamma chain
MTQERVGRREFLTAAGAAGLVSVQPLVHGVSTAQAQTSPAPASQVAASADGYMFFHQSEAAFVEALVDHMVPKDELTGSGTDLGINVYIDRALAGAWGQGARFYAKGPFGKGTANQGYQLPLTPAALYRAGIEGANTYCRKTYGKAFDKCAAAQKEAFLKDMSGGKVTLPGGLAGRIFFGVLYTNVMEGMFGDPIYGGNKDKAAWKMLGFPGVMANNTENIKKFGDGQRFNADPVSIADMS